MHFLFLGFDVYPISGLEFAHRYASSLSKGMPVILTSPA